jgi:hypothetical protein
MFFFSTLKAIGASFSAADRSTRSSLLQLASATAATARNANFFILMVLILY